MLNPESVNFVDGETKNVGISFTDGSGDPVLMIGLSSLDAMSLVKMIMQKCSYKAKLEYEKIK